MELHESRVLTPGRLWLDLRNSPNFRQWRTDMALSYGLLTLPRCEDDGYMQWVGTGKVAAMMVAIMTAIYIPSVPLCI